MKLLPKKSADITKWYTSVIQLADLADYGPTKGTMVIKPYGYAIWEAIQASLDAKIKQRGVKNVYFPSLIPMELLQKEAKHVEGFSPELAVVTHGGGEKLEAPLAVRPTSETIMYEMFSKWIQSYRDLPLNVNQWCNVIRWEKRTSLFLRTSEFLWQEGHTVHATHKEAQDMQQWAINAYQQVFNEDLAIFGYVGEKSIAERFAGADNTLTFESLMPSGKALQSSTSHDLGQNFSKSFGIRYSGEDGETHYPWQTSWGLSTRSIGGLILMHGDDNGLRLPPRVAPIQVIIVVIKPNEAIEKAANELSETLKSANVRVEIDNDQHNSIGWRMNEWELKGVPIRVELGPKDFKEASLTAVRRDTSEKSTIKLDQASAKISSLLEQIQSTMFEQSKKQNENNVRTAQSYDEFKKIIKEHKGFIKVHWNDNPEIEDKIQKETKATSRCKLESGSAGKDFYSSEPASDVWLFAQAY